MTDKQPTPQRKPRRKKSEEFERMEELARKLFQVPKTEVDELERKRQKRAPR